MLLATVSRKCFPSSLMRKQAGPCFNRLPERGKKRAKERLYNARVGEKERERARVGLSQYAGMCLGRTRLKQPRWLWGNPWHRVTGKPRWSPPPPLLPSLPPSLPLSLVPSLPPSPPPRLPLSPRSGAAASLSAIKTLPKQGRYCYGGKELMSGTWSMENTRTNFFLFFPPGLFWGLSFRCILRKRWALTSFMPV